jgi:hypothetical protein
MRRGTLAALVLALVVAAHAPAAGDEWQLTTTAMNWDPAWCGDVIAFTSDRSPVESVWAMGETGESGGTWHITLSAFACGEAARDPGDPACSFIYFEGQDEGQPAQLYFSYVNSYFPIQLTTQGDNHAPSYLDAGIVFHSDRAGNDDIIWMDINGEATAWEYLTTSLAADRFPCWSPDASEIAFASDRLGDMDIWVMSADGEGAARLTSGTENESEPAWSPNGQFIAFQREGVGIFAFDVATRAEYQVTSGAGDTSPAWSPDNTKIAFDRDGQIWCTDAVPESAVRQSSWGSIKALYR